MSNERGIGEFTVLLDNSSVAPVTAPSPGKRSPSAQKAKGEEGASQAQPEIRRASEPMEEGDAPEMHGSGGLSFWPIPGGQVNSAFGDRSDPMTRGRIEHHGGIDIPAQKGTPIYAAGDGVVVAAGPVQGFGSHAVYIQHPNGLTTVYGHGSAHNVKLGQAVKAGDKVAEVGSEGHSTGNHLHFGVLKGGVNGHPINPLDFFGSDKLASPTKNDLNFSDTNHPRLAKRKT